jgi:hypothetical protein
MTKELYALSKMTILNLFKNKLFRITFVLFTAGFLLISGKVSGFNYFKVWTLRDTLKIGNNYVQEEMVDDAAMGTVIAQIYSNSATSYTSNGGLISRGLKLFNDTQALVSVNITDLVKNSKDPARTIDLHNAHISKKIEELDIVVGQLKDMAAKKSQLSTECLARKKLWDQTFLQWVSANDPRQVQEWITLSTTDAPCYMTNRIEANAYIYLAERIQGYKSALTTRKSLLEKNKDAIITYGDKLDSTIDKELSTLKMKFAELRNYERSVSAQVGW